MRFAGYEVEKKRLSHTVAMQMTNEIVALKKISTPKSHVA
jgi:HAMP domain-containing protein